MVVRQLKRSDLEDYKKIRLNALKNDPEAFGSSYEEESIFSDEQFLRRFKRETAYIFGAFVAGEIVGLCSLSFQPRKKMEHRADIHQMYVEPFMRNKGIGRALIEKVLEMATSREETEQIYLTVVDTNAAAKRLYETFGFKTYGVEKRAMKYNGVYYDHVLMVLLMKRE